MAGRPGLDSTADVAPGGSPRIVGGDVGRRGSLVFRVTVTNKRRGFILAKKNILVTQTCGDILNLFKVDG